MQLLKGIKVNLSWHMTSLIVVISYLAKWKLCKINNVSPLKCCVRNCFVTTQLGSFTVYKVSDRVVVTLQKILYRCNQLCFHCKCNSYTSFWYVCAPLTLFQRCKNIGQLYIADWNKKKIGIGKCKTCLSVQHYTQYPWADFSSFIFRRWHSGSCLALNFHLHYQQCLAYL